MADSLGVRGDDRTEKGQEITLWSGPFMSVFEATGYARDGARRITMTDYSDEQFVVVLPKGMTFPRTDENFLRVDDVIRQAYSKHSAKLGRVQVVS